MYAPNFGLAAEIAYQARVNVAIAGYSRLTQFDFWPQPVLPLGSDALFVSEWDAPPPEPLTRSFQSVEGPTLVDSGYRDRPLHSFHLWRLKSSKGEPQLQRPPITAPSPQG